MKTFYAIVHCALGETKFFREEHLDTYTNDPCSPIGAAQFNTVREALSALQRKYHRNMFTYDYLGIARVTEIPGVSTPEKIERAVIGENEVCREKEVSWVIQFNTGSWGHYTMGVNHYYPDGGAWSFDHPQTKYFNTVAEASAFIPRLLKSKTDATNITIVPVGIRRTPAVTSKSTFTITVLE